MVQCLNFLEKTMSIKQKIKFKQGYRGRGTSSAELRSTGPKLRPEEGSVESSAVEETSTERDGDLPTDMIRFEEHSEEEYRAHLKKFFKGKDET
jgi:hypothetical protein